MNSRTTPTEATGPLQGIRVLDFSHALAGPYCTMFLGDLGAEIIKVEHPRRGDGTRHMGTPLQGRLQTDYFMALNRNKRSVALDLKVEADRDAALELAAGCDVLVHNFRPGVMERLGLGYEDVRARREDLIYAAISGFGERGELMNRGANDITMQAMAGLMSTTGEIGGAPLRLGISAVDMTTGLFTMSGVLAALYHRAQTGEGQRVHVSMLASATALLANYVPGVLNAGEEIVPLGREHAQLVPYQAFETSDGRYVIVGAFTQAFWRRFATLLGLEELIEDPRFATNGDRLRHRTELIPLLEGCMRTRPRAEWLRLLEEQDIPTAEVLTVSEALRHPQTHAVHAVTQIVDGERDVWMAGLPIDMSQTPGGPHGFPPELGEHTDEILSGLAGRSTRAR